jgi:hypothetical protein
MWRVKRTAKNKYLHGRKKRVFGVILMRERGDVVLGRAMEAV